MVCASRTIRLLLGHHVSLFAIVICASCLLPYAQFQTVRQKKMFGSFGHETSDAVVSGQTRGGGSVFPLTVCLVLLLQ